MMTMRPTRVMCPLYHLHNQVEMKGKGKKKETLKSHLDLLRRRLLKLRRESLCLSLRVRKFCLRWDSLCQLLNQTVSFQLLRCQWVSPCLNHVPQTATKLRACDAKYNAYKMNWARSNLKEMSLREIGDAQKRMQILPGKGNPQPKVKPNAWHQKWKKEKGSERV